MCSFPFQFTTDSSVRQYGYGGTDYMFLYYLLKYSKDKIENLGSGTTFKEISGSTMRGIEVFVPEAVEEQRRIASILSMLDDKIEKNIAVNENLAA